MRRSTTIWIALAVLVASIAGIGWLAWSARSPRAEQVLSQPAGEDAPEVGERGPADASAQDESGEVRLAPPASANERAPAPLNATAVEPTRATLAVLVIARGTGVPIEGVHVHTWPVDGRWEGASSIGGIPRPTDAHGRVEFEVEAGTRLGVDAIGDMTDDFGYLVGPPKPDGPVGNASLELEPLIAGERRDLTLDVPVGLDLAFFGRVVDENTGAPIPGARAFENFTEKESFADERGLLEVHVRSWDPGTFELRAEGFGMRRFVPSAGHERADEARRLALLSAATLQVTLRDAGPKPLDSLSVRLSTEGYELDMPDQPDLLSLSHLGGGDRTWSATCAADGSCVLTDLPARVPLEVEILRAEESVLRPGSMSLEPGEVRVVEWRLNAGARLRGVVSDQDGVPVANCALGRFASSAAPDTEVHRGLLSADECDKAAASTASDEDGHFVFEDVMPGTWWIGPCPDQADASEVAAVAVRLDVPIGVAEHFVELRAERGLFVRGRVLAPDGSTPEDCWIVATGDSTGGLAQADMEIDGSFRLGPLPSGSYRLRAMSWGSNAPSREVVARAGDEGVVLQLEPAGRLAGVVLDPRANRGIEAQLVISTGDDPWDRTTLGADGEGSFDEAGFTPGTYDLVARTADGRIGVLRGVAVDPGTTNDELRLEVQPGARIELRFEGERDYVGYEVRSQGVAVAFDGSKRGAVTVLTVLPGAIEVELMQLGGATIETQRAELAVGEEQRFVIPRCD